MSEKTKKSVWWWTKTALEGIGYTAIAFAPELLQLFPDHTLAFKLALPIGFLVKFFRVKTAYNKGEELPAGLVRQLNKLPDRITGINPRADE